MLTKEEKEARAKYPVYYTAPDDDVFNELREAAIDRWNDMDYPGATHYADSLPHTLNITDNFMHILASFDVNMQIEVVKKLSAETKAEIRKRLLDVGEKELADHIGV